MQYRHRWLLEAFSHPFCALHCFCSHLGLAVKPSTSTADASLARHFHCSLDFWEWALIEPLNIITKISCATELVIFT